MYLLNTSIVTKCSSFVYSKPFHKYIDVNVSIKKHMKSIKSLLLDLHSISFKV